MAEGFQEMAVTEHSIERSQHLPSIPDRKTITCSGSNPLTETPPRRGPCLKLEDLQSCWGGNSDFAVKPPGMAKRAKPILQVGQNLGRKKLRLHQEGVVNNPRIEARIPTRTPLFSTTSSMQGQELTYAVLGRTRNEAAVDVLLACLDSELREHRDMALSTLMQQREDRVPAKLLARWQQLKQRIIFF